MKGNFHARCGRGEKMEIISKSYLSVSWRPGDLAQRKGRIERQGNQNSLVHVYRYVTEGTFDAYLWQTVENKQKFISQIMTSKSPVRSCDDVDETALSFFLEAYIKALYCLVFLNHCLFFGLDIQKCHSLKILLF